LQGFLFERDLFDWFRRQKPATTLGYSIFVYDVAEQAAGEWIALCLIPTPLLTASEAEELVGQSGLRHVAFDCRQSWVFPGGGTPGWYIVPQGDATDWLTSRVPEETLAAVYRHRPTSEAPGYLVYYWATNANIAAVTAFAGTGVQLPDGATTALPVAASPSLALQGYQQTENEWWNLWAVQSTMAEPVSLMAHLYPEKGNEPLIADGLGYTADQWQPGDQFIQRHTFPGAAAARYLETGLYNYLTQEAAGPRLRLFADTD
jgi:hypothetical protein